MITSIYPRSYDPTFGIYAYSLCKQIAQNHEIQVISPQPWPARFTKPSPSDEEMNAAVGPTVYPTYFYPPKMLQSRCAEFMWASVRIKVKSVVGKFRPDCVISYWAHPDGEVAVRSGRLAGVPTAIIVGGSDVLILTKEQKRRAAIAKSLQQADAVLAVSKDLMEKVVALSVDRNKVHLFHRGIDQAFSPGDPTTARSQLGLPANGNLLFWVGRMVPVKGLDVLIQACAELRSRRLDFELCLAGDGPLRTSLEAEVQRLDLAKNVRFLGMIPHERLPNWYRA